jgi:hypothetical protein
VVNVRVSLRGLKVRMAQHLLQQKHVSTTAQIPGCECVPGSVERAPWCGESQREAQSLYVVQHVAAIERRFRRCRERKRLGDLSRINVQGRLLGHNGRRTRGRRADVRLTRQALTGDYLCHNSGTGLLSCPSRGNDGGRRVEGLFSPFDLLAYGSG